MKYTGKGIISFLFGALLLTAALCFYVFKYDNIFYTQSPKVLNRLTDNNLTTKISSISAENIYDLTGSEMSGGSNWMKLFDENCDPKFGLTGNPSSNPLPLKGWDIYFPKNKGLSIVIDLKNYYRLSDIYFFNAGKLEDSIYFYNEYKLLFNIVNNLKSIKYGWNNYSLSDSVRYLKLCFNSPKSQITELVLYGNIINQHENKISKNKININSTSSKTLSSFMGINSYDLVDINPIMKPFHTTRLYQNLDYCDTSISNNISTINYNLNIFNLSVNKKLGWYADSLKKMYSNIIWPSIRGISKYLQSKGYNQHQPPVDEAGLDSDNPASFYRHANLFWNLSAAYGSNKIDTALLQFVNNPRLSGLNVMDTYENGNEEDAIWTKDYWTPTTYFAVSTADYDGNEGKMGKRFGIKNADPNSKLMMSGMIQLDTNRVKTLKFLCDTRRKDKKFIWQAGVQYHLYCNDGSTNKQATHGISPEAYKMRKKLAEVKQFQQKLLPGIPVILGENGYDRNQQSWQATPVIKGLTEAESQGVMTIRSVMAAFMSGIDGYNYYMLRNATNDENPAGVFASSGMISGPAGANKIYPIWYYWHNIVTKIGDFVPEAIIKETGTVWVYKLRNRVNPTQVMFYMVNAKNDDTINFKLTLKKLANNIAQKINWYYTNRQVANETIQIINNNLNIQVSSIPVFVIVNL